MSSLPDSIMNDSIKPDCGTAIADLKSASVNSSVPIQQYVSNTVIP